MSKTFTIIKTGYSKGVYGCSNEFFTLIIFDIAEIILFRGMYGIEHRVAKVLMDHGYTYRHSYANYGVITRKDVMDNTLDEYQAIEKIKSLLIK